MREKQFMWLQFLKDFFFFKYILVIYYKTFFKDMLNAKGTISFIFLLVMVNTASVLRLFERLILYQASYEKTPKNFCPVGWIHTAYLQKGKIPSTSVLDMILNNLMVRLEWCWSFGECRVPFIGIVPRSALVWSGSTW